MRVERRTIELAMLSGALPVEAHVIGLLAAHELPGERRVSGASIWSVTHVPSGLRIGGRMGFDSCNDALAMVRALNALPVDWAIQGGKDRNPYLAGAIEAMAAVCNGFIIKNSLDNTEGTA